tara:strand:+ start:396 stop:602 length:207 start_codon:yes stop_codon:yes gene_type:complete
MQNTNTEKIAISYDVLDYQDEVVRSAQISGTFPIDTSWIDIADELLDRAYEREMKRSWLVSYSIIETP